MDGSQVGQDETLRSLQGPVDELARRRALDPTMQRVYDILGAVWNAALDACGCKDGRGLDGTLAETTKTLVAQGSAFDTAATDLMDLFARDGDEARD